MRQVGLLWAVLAGPVAAALPGEGPMTVYVDAKQGDDARDGTAPERAWKTIGPLGTLKLEGGLTILFKGGQTFSRAGFKGPMQGWIIGSYGEGRAVLDGGKGDGLLVEDAEAFTIRDLTVRGAGRKTGNERGSGVLLRRCQGATIRNVEAEGFQRAGIAVEKSSDVTIEDCHAHDNGFAGIHVNGRKITVRRCRAINNPGDPTILNNHSGNGILVSGADDSLVELCEAAGNGWDQPKGGQGNGPVGIWCHDVRGVTIRRCIAHHNKSTSGDGGGYDFDGGTRDSVLEYNYSYENYSSGFLIWEYGSQHPIKGNVIRYNVSVNDREGGIRMGISGGQVIQDLDIHHNTIINTRWPCVNLQGSYAGGKWEEAGGLKNVRIHDNVLIGPKGGEIVKGKGDVAFKGNLYWSMDGVLDKAALAKLDPTGLVADPLLADMKLVPQLTDPARLAELTTFRPIAGAPQPDLGAPAF